MKREFVGAASNGPASLLAAVFFFSGLASLIYQVAWQRLLTVSYGVGAVSITLIVSVTMLGLGLGSLLGGRLAERTRDPFALYAFIEAALGTAGLVSFPLILGLGRLTAGSEPAVSFVGLFALLCIPTLLMGITLPLLTTIFTHLTRDFIHSVSRLYFVNTLGAAAGSILTGYLLVPLFGLNGCITIAAATNFILAATILLARWMAAQTFVPPPSAETLPDETSGLGRWAYLLVFCTGFIAIGYEIVWYRVIGVLVKDSPYAFSSVLAVYLLGLALGSRAIHKYLAGRLHASRRDLYFACQFLIGLTVLFTFAGYYHLSHHGTIQWLTRLSFSAELHPSLDLLTQRPGLGWFGHIFLLLDVFLWPLAFMLVPAMLMGASFPLISSLALTQRGGAGAAVGTTFFFGVLGNVLGGLVTGLVLLPTVGTETTVLAFGSIGLLFGLAYRRSGDWRLPAVYRFAGIPVLLAGAFLLFPHRGKLYAAMHEAPFNQAIARFEEGLDAVVLTYEDGAQLRNFINGQGHGYRPGPLFYAEAVEALTFTPSPRKVLVIGFGAGSITEAALLPAEVQQVTVVELCATSIVNLRKFPACAGILGNPKVRLVIDDGRRFLHRSGEMYDAILMDPLRTTTAYSNNLHSQQFFALAAKHLAPGGILMVGGIGDSRVIPRTLMREFPHVRAYPSFSLASKSPMRQDRARLELLFGSFSAEMQAAIWTLMEGALEGKALVLACAGYPANQDWRPVSEYYLGLQLRHWLARFAQHYSPSKRTL